MRSGRSRNDRRSSPASPSGHRSALIPDVWEWPQLHRATLEGRRLAFTSIASGQQAPWERVRGRTSISLTAFACPKQPPALTLVVVKPLETSAARCSRTLQGNFLRPRAPKMYNLRADLFERGTESQAGGDERTVVYSLMLE